MSLGRAEQEILKRQDQLIEAAERRKYTAKKNKNELYPEDKKESEPKRQRSASAILREKKIQEQHDYIQHHRDPIDTTPSKRIEEMHVKLNQFKAALLVNKNNYDVCRQIWQQNTLLRDIFCGGKSDLGSYHKPNIDRDDKPNLTRNHKKRNDEKLNDKFGLLPVTVLENLLFMYANFPIDMAHSVVENPNFTIVMGEFKVEMSEYKNIDDDINIFSFEHVPTTVASFTSIKNEKLKDALMKACDGQYEEAVLAYTENLRANTKKAAETDSVDKIQDEPAEAKIEVKAKPIAKAAAKPRVKVQPRSVLTAPQEIPSPEVEVKTEAKSEEISQVMLTPQQEVYDVPLAPAAVEHSVAQAAVDHQAAASSMFLYGNLFGPASPIVDPDFMDYELTEHVLFGNDKL